jgi:uncharacterized membrane protein (UPF0127 family)
MPDEQIGRDSVTGYDLLRLNRLAAKVVMSHNRETLTIKTPSAEHVFDVDVARSREEHERGLMGREELPSAYGMLFLEEREIAKRMWMKGTPISLDMIFIKKGGTIHRIERNTVPFSTKKIWSGALVTGVLEVAGGTTRTLNINEGDKVLCPALS